jgi:hypothetical protein
MRRCAPVTAGDSPKRSGERAPVSVGRRIGEPATSVWLDDAEDVRRSLAYVLVICPGGPTGANWDTGACWVEQLDGALVKADDRLSLAIRARVQRQHVLHAVDELLTNFGHAPHFFPARASDRAWRGPLESSRTRRFQRSRGARPPGPAAAGSIVCAHLAADRRRSRRPRPADRYRASALALVEGLLPVPAADHRASTASRPAKSPAGTHRPRPPSRARSPRDREAATPESVATAVLLAASALVASAAARPGRRS